MPINLQPQNKLKKSLHIFYILSLATHILVLTKIIPYSSVNDGRSTSYQIQAAQSTISIAVIGFLYFFTIKFINASKTKKMHTVYFYALTGFWGIGYIMQLLGTSLERFVLSFVLIIGFVTHYLSAKLSAYSK